MPPGRGFYGGRRSEGYDTAAICKSGHVLTTHLENNPSAFTEYCKECGDEVIKDCMECDAPVRGHHVRAGGLFDRPNYCHNCGVAYPWLAAELEAARELVALEESLTPDEREALKQDIDRIVTDSPEAKPAAARFKATLTKVTEATATGLREFAVDVASETAKKVLTGE